METASQPQKAQLIPQSANSAVLVVAQPITYWKAGYGLLTMEPGQYPLSELGTAEIHATMPADGVRCWVLLPNGTTRPTFCENPRFDGARALSELLATRFTAKPHMGGTLFECKVGA